MSSKDAKLFFQNVESNKDLQKLMRDALKEMQEIVCSKNIELIKESFKKNIVQKANDLGYNFTIDEIPREAFVQSHKENDNPKGEKANWDTVKGIFSDIWRVIEDPENQDNVDKLYDNIERLKNKQ